MINIKITSTINIKYIVDFRDRVKISQLVIFEKVIKLSSFYLPFIVGEGSNLIKREIRVDDLQFETIWVPSFYSLTPSE